MLFQLGIELFQVRMLPGVAAHLRNCENKSDSAIFAFGVFMGGAYEYVCSAVGELLFGVIFWDYSGFKFNIAGRVNLLYCFFWGIAEALVFSVFFMFSSRWGRHAPSGRCQSVRPKKPPAGSAA